MKRIFLIAVLSVLPLSISPSETAKPLPVQEGLCGDGSCCKNPDAICGLNGKNYEGYEYNGPRPCSGVILI